LRLPSLLPTSRVYFRSKCPEHCVYNQETIYLAAMGSFVVFVVAAVLCLSGYVEAQDPEIVDEIWPEVQPLGRTGRLNCTVAKLGVNSIEWYHEDSDQAISIAETIQPTNPVMGGLKKFEVRVRSSGDRQTHMLIVRRLRQQDAGTYVCKIRIVGVSQNRWTQKKGLLTVQVAPTIRDGGTTAVLEVSRGSNATLHCQATGIPHPNITWTRSDGGLLPVLPLPVAQFRATQLTLINVGVRHMGVYRCVADNNIKPPAEHLAEVRVFHPPRTRVVQNSVGQAQNRRFSAKLECIVQGHPEPTVTFKRRAGEDIVPISDDDKFEVNKQTTDNQNLKAMEQWYSLKVKNVQANDYTMFYCDATNVFGTANSTIKLFETTECQGSNCPSLPPSSCHRTTASTLVTALVGVITYMMWL